MSDARKTITFELAPVEEVQEPRERTQMVTVATDMTQRCARCKQQVMGEPLGLRLSDVVSHKERSDAHRAVALALYTAEHPYIRGVEAMAHLRGVEAPTAEQRFCALPWETQVRWLRHAAGDGLSSEDFALAKIGGDLSEAARAAGVEEAKKWRAFTDKRKVFRVDHAQFPPGWLVLAFEAHRSATGEPVKHGNVMVHICPDCSPAVFAAVGIDPRDPFGNGARW